MSVSAQNDVATFLHTKQQSQPQVKDDLSLALHRSPSLLPYCSSISYPLTHSP